MKKIFIVLMFLGVTIIACNEKENIAITPVQIDEQVAFAELQAQLDAYSVEFKASLPTVSITGPQKVSWWKKLLTVVKADVAGAEAGGEAGKEIGTSVGEAVGGSVGGSVGGKVGEVIGGIVGAVSYSAQAIVAESSGSNSLSTLITTLNNGVPTTILLGTTSADSVGFFHNMVIAEMAKADITNAKLQNIDSLVHYTAITVGQLRGTSVSSILRDSVKSQLVEDSPFLLSGTGNLFSKYEAKYSSLSGVSAIIETYFDNVATLTSNEDILSYTTGYRNTVVLSRISAAKKDVIIASLSVAINSFYLWNM
ncbi:MAG: hypothetical protein LBF19_06445 [Prevotellaceae bacterium]|jgi:hypothetical protein|nr:hypothetical protein [Prevotellaceae bacterium]